MPKTMHKTFISEKNPQNQYSNLTVDDTQIYYLFVLTIYVYLSAVLLSSRCPREPAAPTNHKHNKNIQSVSLHTLAALSYGCFAFKNIVYHIIYDYYNASYFSGWLQTIYCTNWINSTKSRQFRPPM